MNDELLALVQLQETDQNINQLRAEIAALPKRLAALEEKLIRQKAGVDEVNKAIKDEEVKRRRFESDLKDLQQKIVEVSRTVEQREDQRAVPGASA